MTEQNQTQPIRRIDPKEPLARYWHAIRAAEATQRALAEFVASAEKAGMTDLVEPGAVAWAYAKSTVDMVKQIPQPENITPPLQVPLYGAADDVL